MNRTEPRGDGNFYCADFCIRCEGVFYTHAMKNVAFRPAYELQVCPRCRGECSAAEQDHFNTYVEDDAKEGLR